MARQTPQLRRRARWTRWGLFTTLAASVALGMASCEKKATTSGTGTNTAPEPTVTGVSVTGATPTIGTNSGMTATATLSNGASQNVTTLATWRTSNAAIANVGSTGIVTGVSAGVVDITATYQTGSGSIRLTIATPTPVTVNLTGRVTDGTSGAIIANADVSVTSGVNTGRSARSDSSGRYTLAQMTVGTMTLRGNANHSAYQTLDRSVTASSDTTLDFVLPRVGSTPTPPPSGGSGAFVRIDTDSRTCGCSRGTITVTANGAQIGTTTCSPATRTFNVSPGSFTLRACDDLGCWNDASVTVGSGGTFGWLLTCTSTLVPDRQAMTPVPTSR